MMKLKSRNSIVTFAVLLFVCISGIALINGCRKTDRIENIPSVNNTEKRFFNEHQSSDPLVQAINKFFSRKNETKHFVEKTVSLIGYPRWDKSMLISSTITSRGNSEDSVNVVYIPFVRDSQNYVNASMIIRTTPSDTTFRYLCDWEYNDYGIDTAGTGWNARDIFHVFAMLDRSVFGRNSFRIKDEYLLTQAEKDYIINMGLTFDSTVVIYTLQPSQNSSGRNNLLLPVEVCDDVMVCIRQQMLGFRIGGSGRSSTYDPCPQGQTPFIFTLCTTVMVEIPTGGVGGSGSGGGNPPSGGGGGGSTPPDPDCEGSGTGNRSSNYENPCGPGWVPIDDDPPPTEDPCSTSDAFSGASATSQYIGLSSTVQQFAPFDLNNTNQPEQFFVVDIINGSNVPGPIQTSTPNGGSINQSVTPNTVMVVHTHPFGALPGPSAGDYFALASFGSNFQISYIVAFDGTKYAIVINNLSQFQQFTANYANSLNPDGSLDPNSPLGSPFYGLRQLLISQGYSYDEAHERALAYIMNQAGVRLTKAATGSNTFKKIGIRQKVVNGIPQTDPNGLPIYENADCP